MLIDKDDIIFSLLDLFLPSSFNFSSLKNESEKFIKYLSMELLLLKNKKIDKTNTVNKKARVKDILVINFDTTRP
tara:strand:+ start:262 stop:486 length:225 start_codon:yes stop_codon:yes gene_type:complete